MTAPFESSDRASEAIQDMLRRLTDIMLAEGYTAEQPLQDWAVSIAASHLVDIIFHRCGRDRLLAFLMELGAAAEILIGPEMPKRVLN